MNSIALNTRHDVNATRVKIADDMCPPACGGLRSLKKTTSGAVMAVSTMWPVPNIRDREKVMQQIQFINLLAPIMRTMLWNFMQRTLFGHKNHCVRMICNLCIQISQKSWRIGCVIPHSNLQRGITQPILLFYISVVLLFCTFNHMCIMPSFAFRFNLNFIRSLSSHFIHFI